MQLVASARGEDLNLRLRIAWGGGTPRSWQGTISLPEGTLAEISPLGMEADVPGSMRLVGGEVHIARRTTRQFDGLDLLVTGPPEARLAIEILPGSVPGGGELKPQRVEVTLASVVDEVQTAPLDDTKNRLIVRRAPGDKLRVEFERESLIFRPGEEFRFEVSPHLAGLPAEAALKCQVQLLKARTETEVWSRELDVKTDAEGATPPVGPISLELPSAEGVYDVLISLAPRRVAPALVRPRPLVQRKLQLLVLAETAEIASPAEWKTLFEIDAASPRWWDKLKSIPQLSLIPGMKTSSLGSGDLKVHEHLRQKWAAVAAGGWQAIPLAVGRVGEPHILEIEYPSDERQTLGISLVEPNAAGAIAPLGLDSGVQVTSPVGTPRVERHRLVFWPRTKTPFVLFTNRRTDAPAVFGKLRVLAGPKTLPSVPLANRTGGERLYAAYLDKPLFPENFGASEALDTSTNRSLDDWETFYQGGRRLVEYLKFAGYNGAIVSVACEGSAIYPSRLLQPTPKYDSGVFFATGQDPQRKDVLELLFTLFDREGLRLIPAVQFSAPLPALESLRDVESEVPGIDLVDLEGRTWLARFGEGRGLAPRYNPLDRRVQTHLVAVVEELAERYGRHPAYGGLALQLGPETCVQFPGEEWGNDDSTFARFAKDSRLGLSHVAAAGAVRKRALLTGEARDAWLAWRARQLAALHLQMQRSVARHNPEAKLYLTGADLFTGKEMQAALQPDLTPRARLADALRRVGLDLELHSEEAGLLFPRPERLTAAASLAAQTPQLVARLSPDEVGLFKPGGASGSLFFHEPLPLRLAAFDEAAPFGGKSSYTWLATLAVPAGPANRARFTRALAESDSQWFFDGGWMTPLGQEDALQPFLEAYRALPAEPFQTVVPKTSAGRTQPVTVRTLRKEDVAYCYLVNDSPWPVSVDVELDAPNDCRVEPLAGRKLAPLARQAGRARWAVALEPYDLVAAQFSSPRATVESWQVTLPPEAGTELEQHIQQVRARANALKNSVPLTALQNSGFESPARQQTVPEWARADDPGLTITVDREVHRGGTQSLHMRSRGPVGWVRSSPFDAPATGRLSVWVWLRVADPKKQPALRLAIEGKSGSEVYYRFAEVGAGREAPRLDAKWAPYLFQVNDLPASGLSDLRVGFDLMGAGEVWMDDVQVYDAWFYDNERDELLKQIALADTDLAAGRVADCRRFLDSYWPKFLLAHVPAEAPRVAPKPAEPRSASRENGRPKKPSLLERWNPFSKNWGSDD